MADAQIPELLELVREICAHPAGLAAGREGSAALKISDERMAITPRGARLAQLTAPEIVELDLPKTAALAAGESLPEGALAEATLHATQNEPSLDALFYASFLAAENIRFAVHVHPVEINQITASPRARQFADRRTLPHEVLACGNASLLIPYADPGLALARETQRKMILWRDRYKTSPHLVLVQNHGMFVLGPSRERILATIEMTLKAARTFSGAAMLGGPVFLTPTNVAQIEAAGEL